MLTRMIYPYSLREKISCQVKKLFPNAKDKNVSIVFDDKLKFDLSKKDVGHQSIIFNGYYDLKLTRSILKLGAEGGLMLDVGANYGYFSCLWASQNSSNRVLAFEASPVNVQPLTNNVKKNKLTGSVKIIPNAVGKEKGKLKFDLGNESEQTGWGGLSIRNKTNAVEVEVDTLDNYAARNEITKVKVLKIDTEGADTWVLYGAELLLKEKRIDHIFFEHNLVRMKDLDISEKEAKIFLEKLDYVVEQRSSVDFYAYPKG